MVRHSSLIVFALCCVHADCGGDPPLTCRDLLPGQTQCGADSQCDDGDFCNGIERCTPGATGASACGCIHAATPACTGTRSSCDEEASRCLVPGCEGSLGDSDGDGHERTTCGGDDCDDADSSRFPGRSEVCDGSAHDEDCDPSTYGFRDTDGDLWPDMACCNSNGTGGMNCGTDCNDSQAGEHPAVPEVCNQRDDDCDGAVDEGGLKTQFFIDGDADGYGSTTGTLACLRPVGQAFIAGDCDDSNPAIVPGAIRCTAKVNEYQQCTSGSYVTVACPGQELCHPQPNGTGICF